MLKIPVLVYHAIGAVASPGLERWTVSRREFECHLEVIAGSGHVPLTVCELAACLRGERRLDRKALAVTFDDGYVATQDAVRELLRCGVSSTIYVTTGEIGTAGMLCAEQLEQLARLEGVELGAHSISHPHLDELSGARLDEEVSGSKRALETLAGTPVSSFAYPHGSHDRRSRAAVVRAGYGSAVAVKNAISHLGDDPFAIARWTVASGTSAERLAAVLSGEAIPVAWSGERMRTRAYRLARRARRRVRERRAVSQADRR